MYLYLLNNNMKKFSVWLEQKDYLSDTILSIFGGSNVLGDQEKQHLLGRNTNEFSGEITNRLLNLGMIKSLFQLNPNKYVDIKNMVKRGVLIQDLIEKLKGEDLAPNAEIK